MQTQKGCDYKDCWHGFTYDEIGNPLSYYNGKRYTFTWENGRRLETATVDGVTLTFTYNADGIRTSKTVGGSEHIYHLNGTQIITETWTQGQSAMIYLYDAEGSPIGMKYRDGNMADGEFEEYWFEKNLQGDIVAVYDEDGTKLISYTYDAWGNFITTYHNGCTASNHANLNPFRYRGYYYDVELGMYYLQSRYYDPVIGRFINADGFISTGQGLLGYNMFSYCGNNPVMGYDPTGCWNWGGFWAGVAIAVVGVAVIAATIASAGAAAPLAATAISTVGTAVGVSVTATGVVTSYAAATETPMVVDVSVSNGDTHDKHGYSIVIDFDSESVSFDTYYHYGKTTSGYGASYGVGFVYGYDEPGDYGGYFVDGGMTYSHNGIAYGLDVCTDPSAPFEKCSAVMLTTGTSFPGSKDYYLGFDYYLPVSYIVWG